MAQSQKGHTFDRVITKVDNRPQIFVVSSSERGKSPGGPATSATEQGRADRQVEESARSAPFFGHHIGKLLVADKATAAEFLPIDEKLESSLEIVRQKLQSTQAGYLSKGRRLSQEEIKHQHFIEERNVVQEALFEDIVRRHGEFGTGLDEDDLWSLHDLMKMEATHEAVCSSEESIHELVECNLLSFLRNKAGEHAWRQLEDYLARFQILFPISPSMEDPVKPVRNEKIREGVRESTKDEFLKMRARELAELILGNVPAWVYSYPRRDTYLWELIVLQGVVAGLEADAFMKYLSVWEENATEILEKIEKEFMDKIEEIRQRGESAISVPDVLSASKNLQRISKKEIPDWIWGYISSKLENR